MVTFFARGTPRPSAAARPFVGALVVGVLCSFGAVHPLASQTPPAESPTPRTRVVLLGTGTPNADPERSGPSLAVLVDDRAYLVDAGPGVVRRAAQASRDLELPALAPARLDRVFLTHLHSDHTLGLPDLLLSPWVLDRPGSLEVYGPAGTLRMLQHIREAWREDIDVRVYGSEPRDDNRMGYLPLAEEVTPGLVFEDDLVKVYAIPVPHGSWTQAFGYRFVGPDRTIVISGDATPSEALIEACNGCDVLVHEVYSSERFQTLPPEWQAYHREAHTSTRELAVLARRARPNLLVLYHHLFWGADDAALLREIAQAGYRGRVVSGADLQIW